MSFVDGDYRDYMNKGMLYDRFPNEEEDMPKGIGTYGKKRGRPKKKKT